MGMSEAQVVANEMERVNPNVPTLFDFDDTFYSKIEKRQVEKVSKRDMRIPLKIRPGGRSGGFDSNGGDLGRGSGPTFDKALISAIDMRHAVEWTTQAQWATDDSRKAVVNTFRDLLATAMSEFRRNVDSWTMTDGTGVMATVSAVSTSGGKDTVTCNAVGDGFGVRLLRDDHTYSAYDSTLATRRIFTGTPSDVPAGEAAIDLYDLQNKQVRFNGTAPVQVGDKIVVSGPRTTPPVWLYGLPYHHNAASTGLWLGLDRSLVPAIRSNQTIAGGAFSLPLARLALNKIGDRVGKANAQKTIAFMHPCQKQAYEQVGQLVSIIQKQAKDEALGMYFGDSMQMAGAPVETGYSADKTRIDFVVTSVWGRAEMHPAGFYEVDGKRMFEIRGSSGGVAASQIFYIAASFNFFVSNPAVTSYISGLTVPTGY
jgi:hypothetical protein